MNMVLQHFQFIYNTDLEFTQHESMLKRKNHNCFDFFLNIREFFLLIHSLLSFEINIKKLMIVITTAMIQTFRLASKPFRLL